MTFTEKLRQLYQEMRDYINHLNKGKTYDLENSDVRVLYNGEYCYPNWLTFENHVGWILGSEDGNWFHLVEVEIMETAEIVDYLKSKI